MESKLKMVEDKAIELKNSVDKRQLHIAKLKEELQLNERALIEESVAIQCYSQVFNFLSEPTATNDAVPIEAEIVEGA